MEERARRSEYSKLKKGIGPSLNAGPLGQRYGRNSLAPGSRPHLQKRKTLFGSALGGAEQDLLAQLRADHLREQAKIK